MPSTNVIGDRAVVEEPVSRIAPKVITYRRRKRLLDIFGSLFLIVVNAPLMLAIVALIKLTSRGPVLYTAERIGLCGRSFSFYKFRSMYLDADKRMADVIGSNEKDGPIFKMHDDPRITRIGRILRHTSMDELPQLFNVFRGDMSLVGPRPPLPNEVAKYDDYAMERLSVRPGMTCYWQIMGRSNLSFDEWMALDHRYLEEMGVWTDLKILLKTPFAVLKGDGAY
ncbi:MAG: sugar transferase [Armatimonadetes bacterium]|nr:sugar transferase [Armatimonadota bacterium]